MRRLAAALALVASVGAACGNPANGTQASPSAGTPGITITPGPVVTIALDDRGRTIDVRQEQRVVVVLPIAPKGPQWILVSYPTNLLTAEPAAEAERFPHEFIASHPGIGMLVAELRCADLTPDRTAPQDCAIRGSAEQRAVFTIRVFAVAGG